MALQIKESLLPDISVTTQSALAKMTNEEQAMFQSDFERKKKSMALLLILAIFFPIQLFLLGKTGLGILFWLTFGGFWVWWVIEIFLTPKRVREYNQDLASQLVMNMKVMNR